MTAEIRLFAAPTAWMSPVKCRLMSSIGSTCACPPPVAPPLTPITGPSDGSRRQTIAFRPSRLIASERPIVVVVLPSPAGVGVIAVTRMTLPCLSKRGLSIASNEILALYFPYGSRSDAFRPSFAAIVVMFFSFAFWASSRSVFMKCLPVDGWVRCRLPNG